MLQVQNISFSYDNKITLQNIDFKVDKGKIVEAGSTLETC